MMIGFFLGKIKIFSTAVKLSELQYPERYNLKKLIYNIVYDSTRISGIYCILWKMCRFRRSNDLEY